MLGSCMHLTGQRHTAGVADKTRNKRRIAPARTAKAKVALHHRPAERTARRIDHVNRRLKSRCQHSILVLMTQTPLTDRTALNKNRQRALCAPVLFLHEIAAAEVEDRLSVVNKSFTAPAVVTGFPQFWHSRMPEAHIVSDDEVLTLDPGAHDLVVHALCLHWANDPVGQLIQARRALRPDGLLLVALFGGATLSELRSALAQAEAEISGGLSPRVLPMAEIRDLGGLMQRAGLTLPVADTLPLTTSYANPMALMRELRGMGESNAMSARRKTLSRRNVLLRACDIYSQAFGTADGRIPATFEMIFLTGWAPDASQPQPLRPGSASARLADALGAVERPLKD